MKQYKISNKLTIALFLLILVSFSAAIVKNGKQFDSFDKPELENFTSITSNAFDSVEIIGNIRVNFNQEANNEIFVINDLNKSSQLQINQTKTFLSIKYIGELENSKNEPSIIVNTSAIKRIIIKEKATAHIKDFKSSNLALDADDAYFNCSNLNIGKCGITLNNGASLNGFPIKASSMDLNLQNKSNIWSSNFEAAHLTGELTSKSYISYKGKTPNIELHIDKGSKINKY